MALSSAQFVERLQKTEFKTARWSIRTRTLGTSDTIFVNFINAPMGVGGADAENNRMMFSINGFNVNTDEPVERLRCELVVSVYRPKFRTRTSKAEKLVEDIQEFCLKIENDFPPSLQSRFKC